MKKMYVFCASLLVLFVGFSTASAFSYYYDIYDGPYDYTGKYLFTVINENDNFGNSNQWNDDDKDDLIGLINFNLSAGLSISSLSFYSKVDSPNIRDSDTDIKMGVSYDPDTLKTGSWFTTSTVDFYTVKGANEFALYWLEGGAKTANWSSEHLLNNGGNQPDMSHISTWNGKYNNPPQGEEKPVPEPSTLLLMGAGIAGLAFYRRKKK